MAVLLAFRSYLLQEAGKRITAKNPDFTWWGNDQTGLFHPADNTMGFTIGGTERMRINSSGHMMMGTTTDNAMINTTSTDYKAAYFNVTLNTDWWNTMTTKVNRAASSNYLVELTGSHTSTCAGINQVSNSYSEISIYPNPFNNKITVVSNGTKQSVQIYNEYGSLVFMTEFDNEKLEIDLEKEVSGIYLIKIGTITKKIIKD